MILDLIKAADKKQLLNTLRCLELTKIVKNLKHNLTTPIIRTYFKVSFTLPISVIKEILVLVKVKNIVNNKSFNSTLLS